MTDLWQDDGFGGGGVLDEGMALETDWVEGEETIATDLEEGLEDPEELEEEDSWEDDAE